MKSFLSFIFAFSACLSFLSCTSAIYRDVYPTLLDGRYDSEFPYKACSTQLEDIAQTVKRVTVQTHYRSYTFPRSDSVRVSDITRGLLDRTEPEAAFKHYNTAGTGTVIYNENGRIALITCAHVVDFQDTVITRYVDSEYRLTPYVRSIALKATQLVFLNDIGGGMTLDILALDRVSDLAILGHQIDPLKNVLVRVFKYPLGHAKELEWGSFVYLFGYPAGYRMVTKGIVSLPSRLAQGSFIVDAVVAAGSSGSIALAIRDGVPNFELVGLIKMIPAQSSYLLTPTTEGDVEYDPAEPYRGEVFVQRKAEVQPGIAIAIPTEAIVSFIQKNRSVLERKGYGLTSWINPPNKEEKIP
jgi:hypothetical protein